MTKDHPPRRHERTQPLAGERAQAQLEQANRTKDKDEARTLQQIAVFSLFSLGCDPENDALAERIDRLVAMCFAMNERLARTEVRLGLDDVPREALQGWTTVKGAAGKCGFSESYIRKLARQERIGARWIGGRLFIDPETLPSPRAGPQRGRGGA